MRKGQRATNDDTSLGDIQGGGGTAVGGLKGLNGKNSGDSEDHANKHFLASAWGLTGHGQGYESDQGLSRED